MLFHYTSFEALHKILLPAPANGKELCFRATRYDCFEDQTEFRYGIDRTKELMEEIEKVDFTEKYAWKEQHFIARHFDSDIILANPNIPKPFVISLTDSPRSRKMWREYGCNGNGVVMGFDFDKRMMNAAGQSLTRLDSCLYYTEKRREAIKRELTDRYFECAKGTAPLGLGQSEIWLKFIFATILCSFCARLKDGKKYTKERETRIILYIPGSEWGDTFARFAKATETGLTQLYDILRSLFCRNQVVPETLEEMLRYMNDIGYNADTGKYYKELYLPVETLKCLWVNKRDAQTVQNLLQERGYRIPVKKARTVLPW